MRRFKISVNGKSYDVAVEEVGEVASAPVAAPAAAPAPVAAAPVAAPAEPAPASAAVSTEIPDGNKVTAPMPGTILQVNVSVGNAVKKGDAIFVLESMKMENEIYAEQDGTIASVNVAKGTVVNVGDVLAVIK